VPGTGCGPFFLEPIAPIVANCFVLTCDEGTQTICFSCSCNIHDNCYDSCGTIKEECDAQFLEDMLAMCAGLDADCQLGPCIERAFVYAALVALAGDASFREGQSDCGDTKDRDPVDFVWDPPFVDEDFDLLPDTWELANGLDPTNPHDGAANIEAFLRNEIL